MPFSLFLYALGAIVLVAYLALRFRTDPVLDAGAGRVLPGWCQAVVRVGAAVLGVLGVVGWAVVLTAGLFGNPSPATNVTWLALSTGLLALFPLLSVLLGDVWRAVSPYRTFGRLAERWVHEDVEAPAWAGWVAPLGVLSLAWFLLARESADEPRGLGAWLLVYSLVILGGTVRWGRAWVDRAEGFGVLFGLFASLAALRRSDEGVVGGPPLVGALAVRATPAVGATLAVGLATVLFDGFTLADPWIEIVRETEGLSYVLAHTVGLVIAVALVLMVGLGTARFSAAADADADEVAVGLVPAFIAVVAGITVAHDLPVVLIEGQFLPILASDPYGQGWDLFGTSSNAVEFDLLSAATFAWLESAAIALGVVGSMLVAHDVLVARTDVRPTPRALSDVACAVAAASLAGIALILGAGGG
jgi:hypothetical protein